MSNEEQPKEMHVITKRNKTARGGECLGSIVIVVGLFAFLENTTIAIVILLIGFVIFLYGRFNE